MTPITSLLAILNVATLADALKRITTLKAATKITADAPSAASAPLAPLACAPEPNSTGASTDPVPHAAAADAPTACKASWFVRAVSGLKDKWRALTAAAAATTTPAAAEKHAPTSRTASATSTTSTSSKSNTAQAAAAAPPGDDARAPEAPKKANWFARAIATAGAKCGAACDSVTASWRATAAKASSALTPKRKASLKKSRGRKADTKTSSLFSVAAAGPIDNDSAVSAAADDAAVLVSVGVCAAPEPPVPALEPGLQISTATTSRWGKILGDRFRAALPHARSCRRPVAPAAPIEARFGGTSAKPCDAEPATTAAIASPKRRISAAITAKLARLSQRRSRDLPAQAAAAAEAVGGEAAVAC